VKLLLDQNLSRKLVPSLTARYPGSSHVVYLDLDTADDATVWRYAREHDFTLMTKNTDMVDLCVVKRAPPKVLWLRVGNCPTRVIADVIELNASRIKYFAGVKNQVVLSLFRLTPVE
jgi:predicted nuclease of predicted toxin-antitoxin system